MTFDELDKVMRSVIDLRDKAKLLFGRADEALDKLLKGTKKLSIEHKGKMYKIVNNFKGKNACFRPACVRRYDIQETK